MVCGRLFSPPVEKPQEIQAWHTDFSFLSWGIACSYFPLYYYSLPQKNFSFKGNSCSKDRWMGSELLLYNTGFLFHAPIWGCRHSTRNAKKVECCHRPEVSCSSVERDHLVCQCELTKRPFHHVPIYQHTPLLAMHALELEQGKGIPKTVLFSFIFPWTHVSKLELCKSRKSCSMGNCFRLYWKS